MADVVLFHHAQGLTAGVRAFADRLRAAGHVVHLPDLYEGRTFADLDDGIAHAATVRFDTLTARGRAAAETLPAEVVYAGMSLGVLPAQALAQTRPGARGAVLLHAAIPLGEFSDTWPEAVGLQLHVMEGDALGDVAEGDALAAAVPGAERYVYPGSDHLFTDASLPAFDEAATSLVVARMLALLDRAGG